MSFCLLLDVRRSRPKCPRGVESSEDRHHAMESRALKGSKEAVMASVVHIRADREWRGGGRIAGELPESASQNLFSIPASQKVVDP